MTIFQLILSLLGLDVGGSVDPNGSDSGTNHDPNGRVGDVGSSIDPNG